MPRKPKYKRRPNNSGTVVKLSGKRRKPFCAKISDTERDIITGKKKQIVIGTFETELEALNALSLYYLTNKKTITDKEAGNIAPDLYEEVKKRRDKKIPTFNELYDKYYNEYVSKLSASSQRNYKSAFDKLSCLHNRKISTISLPELQDVFDECKINCSKNTLSEMKLIVKKVFEQAVIAGTISKNDNLTEYINVNSDFKKFGIDHTAFTIAEIKQLFADNTSEAKLILIYIYTGARPSELLNLPKDRFHFDEECNDDGNVKKVSYLVAGIKTDTGKNRIIPLHEQIIPFVKEILGNKKAFMPYSQKAPYEAYKRDIFMPTMKRLGMKHLPHDTRHTFGTLATLYNLDVYMTKKILGHKFQDLTKDVYTHALINKLYDEIHKIKI